jgi:hypothetical protein
MTVPRTYTPGLADSAVLMGRYAQRLERGTRGI